MVPLQYLWRRIVALVVTLLIACTITFAVFNIIPGDPAMLMLGTEADPEVMVNLRQQLGLDLPLHVQYFRWLWGAAAGDLGTSVRLGRPVAGLIWERLPVTASLAVLAMALTLMVGVPAGAYGATHRGRASDYLVSILTQAGLAIPQFWLGLLLILLFSLRWQLLPPGGFVPWAKNPWQAFLSLLLPAAALASHRVALVARITRTAMLDALSKDYIRTARVRSLPQDADLQARTQKQLDSGGNGGGHAVCRGFWRQHRCRRGLCLAGAGPAAPAGHGYRDLPLVQGITVYCPSSCHHQLPHRYLILAPGSQGAIRLIEGYRGALLGHALVPAGRLGHRKENGALAVVWRTKHLTMNGWYL